MTAYFPDGESASYILIAGMMLVSLLILLWSYRRVLGDRSDA